MEIGQEMHWHRVESNYGHVGVYRVRVKKIGKRVTVEVPLMRGGTRLTSVKPESLRPISQNSCSGNASVSPKSRSGNVP